MFHIELFQAPHRLHRFNLSEQELRSAVLEPWAKDEHFEMGERSWIPRATTIVVLEGPEIPVGSLTMGRGWAVAKREGKDVTDQAIARMREATAAKVAPLEAGVTEPHAAPAAMPVTAGHVASNDLTVLGDALGLELLRGLGGTPMSLCAAWRVASRRHPQASLSIALELAQRAVASLLRARLVTLTCAGEGDAAQLDEAELDEALGNVDAWTAESGASALWIRRA